MRNDYDRIAGSRLRIHQGGLEIHQALSSKESILVRRLISRLNLNRNSNSSKLISLVDELGINSTLQNQPLGVRYATVKRKASKPYIYNQTIETSLN